MTPTDAATADARTAPTPPATGPLRTERGTARTWFKVAAWTTVPAVLLPVASFMVAGAFVNDEPLLIWLPTLLVWAVSLTCALAGLLRCLRPADRGGNYYRGALALALAHVPLGLATTWLTMWAVFLLTWPDP